ncbi:MAG: glycoside hydrolase family 172 protein [Planctomycetota bacterium]
MKRALCAFVVAMMILPCLPTGESVYAQKAELFRKPKNVITRWSSFENLNGIKGQGGKANKGAKGHPYDNIKAGRTKTLLDIKGCGIITRIWITIRNRSPQMLRSLHIKMYWDGAKTPAVSAPFGDFFGVGLGKRVPFENELFSDPEGRSFNCCIPMPFRKAAKIVITNDSDVDIKSIYYDVNYLLTRAHDKDVLYFHTHWRRENPTSLFHDFEILPRVKGKGRFLGTNIGVIADPIYKNTWWGEGETKVFLDGDSKYPTLVGTGTEDYIGTGWGQGTYAHRYQGCLIADEKNRQWAFYRYHIPDPVFFDKDCRVTIQQIGGDDKKKVRELLKQGVPLKPISISKDGNFTRLLEKYDEPNLDDPSVPDGWCNFYRRDDVSATAYFYLDRPENNLPPMAPVAERTRGLK